MRALAAPRAAKVEAQHREPGFLKGATDAEDDFVVHRAAKERVRMTDNGGAAHRRLDIAKDGFDAPRRAFKKRVACKSAHKLFWKIYPNTSGGVRRVADWRPLNSTDNSRALTPSRVA